MADEQQDVAAEARAGLAVITSGEWEYLFWDEKVIVSGSTTKHICDVGAVGQTDADGEFIAAAPRLVRDLLTSLDAANGRIAELEAALKPFALDGRMDFPTDARLTRETYSCEYGYTTRDGGAGYQHCA